MRERYHDLMMRLWLWLFERAPTQGLSLFCVARASHHTYATWTPEEEEATVSSGDGRKPF